MWPFSACATTLNALPSNRFTRYDQPSSSTHTNSSSSILHESESNKDDFDGGGNVGDKFNNTIHLLDFLSKKLILNDANNNSMKLTFEETMANLDSLIAELDQDLRLQAQSGGSLAKLPRLDGANAENLEKYEALLELKEILDRQFREFSLNEEGLKTIDDAIVTENDFEVETPGESKSSSYLISNGKVTEDHLLSDEERLKIPLIGNPKADPSQLPLNEDALNLLVKDGSPGVAIYPMSEQKKVKENITALTGLDFDELIQNVSDSVGKVEFPIKVEEHHTQVTEEAGKRPYYKYTETIADVDPNHANSRDPHVNIVSKRMEEGELLSTEPKQKYRWSGPNPGITATGQVVSDPIRNFAPTLEQIAQSASGQNNDDVKVNVTTKTNIVNVFTFNIYVNNGTSGGQDYQLVKDQPFRSSIETTAEIDAPTPNSEPTKSFSLYQYDASGTSSDMAKEEKKAEEGAELEKWLKILLNHQAYGDGSNIVAEAVLKDSSLQQIPEPSNSLYRMVDEVPSPISSSTTPSIGMLGYKTDSTGELINPGLSTNGDSKIESKTDKTLMETLTGSPIPTIIAGIAAISPFFLAGGKKRRRRKRDVTSVEIPDQWLSYLLGTRYSGAPTTTPKPVSLEYQYEPPLAAKEIHHHQRPTTTTTNVPSTTTTTTTTKKSTIFPSSTTSMSSTATTDFSPTSKSEPTSRTLFVPLYSSTSERPPFPETSLTRTLVRKSEASPSVQISKVRNDGGEEGLEELNRKEPKLERRDPNAPDVSSLLKHWASLYSSAKGSQTTTSSTTRKPINYELYFPASKVTSTTPVTTLSTSESTTTPSLPTSTTTARTFSSSTVAASTENNAIDFNDSINELKDKWSLMTSFNTKLDTLSPFKKKAGYFANGNPVRIIDEAVSVSTSTSTEVNIVPVDAALEKEDDKFVPYYPTLTNSQKKQELPTKPSDGRIKSQNVDPGLWLTAKDILNNLGSKLITESNEEESDNGQKNNDMTNSPIVIIPVEDFNDNPPPVNVQALKPLVSRNPITFINMNNVRPAYKPSTANIEKLSEPPSKQYMESIWSKYNQRFKNQSKPEFVKKETLIKTASKNNIVQISHFPIETTTIGIRRPPWDGANDPNSGVGTIEELQVPPSINIQSGVINTDLTPEVLNQLRTKLGESDEDTDDEESNDIDVEPIYVQAPLSSPNIDNYYALMSSSPTILNSIKESILGLKNFVENGEINDAIDGGGIEEDDYAPLNSPKDYEYLSSTEKIEIEDLDLAGSVSSEDYAPLSKPDQDVPASYEVYDPLSSEDNSELLESLKLQLQNSPLTHALHKGQWVYESQYYTQEEPSPITPQKLVQKVTESTPIYGTKNAFHNGQLLEWIKNLEKDIEPTRRNPITIRTTTASTSDVTSTRSTTQSSSVTTLSTVTTSASSNANNKTVDTRLSLNVVQPLSSATTASPVISTSTANDESPKTIGEIVASALAQSAAPLAGLSAATLAYGAAAMLPVWLPLALGKKRKRRKRRRAERLPTNYDAYSILSKLGSLDN